MVHAMPGIGPRRANAAREDGGSWGDAYRPPGPPHSATADRDNAGTPESEANPWLDVYRSADGGTAASLAALRSRAGR